MTANGNPPPSYRWQREPVGSTTWSDLSDSATYSGTATATLTVISVTEAMSGDSFRCIVTNEVGTVTTSTATLIVASPLTIITLAGSAGSSGSADGTGSAARFNRPSDLAVDSAGNVYVTDTANETVRKITPAGVVTTLAGLPGTAGTADGAGSAAQFFSPTGIAVDSSGNIYVADTDNHTIRKITPAGVVTTLAGRAADPGSFDGSNALFNSPSDVTVDGAGNVYVADTGNNTIRKITPAGVVSTLAGLAGSRGSADGSGSAARFSAPEGVAVDSAGNVYVADTNNHTIRKISPAGAVSTLAGLAGTSGVNDGVGGGARFQYPSDLAVGGSGNLYVADTDNHTIRKISPAGATGTVAGQAGASGSADGTGSTAHFYYPTGIAMDGSGNIYVADTNNNTIRKSTTATAPVITIQPQSQTVTAGTNVQFSVVATGTPVLTYQWLFNGSAISGATSATLTLNSVQTANAGTYTVVVTNIAGSVTSNQATLTVNAVTPPPDGGGGGGGGGTIAAWFVLTLALLCAARLAGRHRRV
jgi:sugar lactone lactonase YvrE